MNTGTRQMDERVRRQQSAANQPGILQKTKRFINKFVSFEKDAIFKDPNWPYLWKRK